MQEGRFENKLYTHTNSGNFVIASYSNTAVVGVRVDKGRGGGVVDRSMA